MGSTHDIFGSASVAEISQRATSLCHGPGACHSADSEDSALLPAPQVVELRIFQTASVTRHLDTFGGFQKRGAPKSSMLIGFSIINQAFIHDFPGMAHHVFRLVLPCF